MDTPIPRHIVDRAKMESCLSDIGKASIREVVSLVHNIEKASGQQFIKMEMGVPGLPSISIGVDAQIEALQNGVASIYAPMDGIRRLKEEASRFAKLFLNIDLAPAGCVHTVGSYNFRGDKLKNKLEEYLSQGDIHTIVYSNPNNPY